MKIISFRVLREYYELEPKRNTIRLKILIKFKLWHHHLKNIQKQTSD